MTTKFKKGQNCGRKLNGAAAGADKTQHARIDNSQHDWGSLFVAQISGKSELPKTPAAAANPEALEDNMNTQPLNRDARLHQPENDIPTQPTEETEMNNERIPEVQDFLDNAAYMTAPQPDQGQLTHIREDAVQCFNFGDNGVRVITRDGEPWFVASDVCKILDLGNVTMTLDRLDKVNINSIEVPNSLGHQRLTQIINEKGLYRLIFTSRKPDALAFQDWVYDTVLPTVRKTGGYMTPALTAAALDDPSALLSLWNASMRHLQVALDKNKELQPAAEYVERIMDSPRPRRAGFSNPELRWSGPRNDAGKRARTSATRPSRDASGARFSFLQPDNALTLFFQRFPVFI